jgi:hypothetical protein
MAQTRGTFSQLHDNTDRQIYVMLDNELKRIPEIYTKYTEVMDSDRKTEISLGVVGFDDVPEKGEGEPYAGALLRPGFEKQVTHTTFAYSFDATEEALEDDKYKQLKKHAMWFMFSAKYVREKRAANLLNNGFTSETTADGLSAFNTAHLLAGTGGTFRNRPSTDVAFSWSALRDAITDFSTQTKHDSGQLARGVQDLVLIVPPQLEMLADRVVNSTGLPGSADNDRNSIKARRNIDIIVNPLLTSATAWFLLAKNKELHGCKSYDRVPITIGETLLDVRTRNKMTPVRFRSSWFWQFAQNSYGNAGA